MQRDARATPADRISLTAWNQTVGFKHHGLNNQSTAQINAWSKQTHERCLTKVNNKHTGLLGCCRENILIYVYLWLDSVSDVCASERGIICLFHAALWLSEQPELQ